MLQHHMGDSPIEIRSAARDYAHGIYDGRRIRGLDAICVGAGRKSGENFIMVLVHGKYNYPRLRYLALEDASERDPIASGQTDIDNRDGRPFTQDNGLSADAVACFGDDTDLAGRLKGHSQAGARQRMVFDKNDGDDFTQWLQP